MATQNMSAYDINTEDADFHNGQQHATAAELQAVREQIAAVVDCNLDDLGDGFIPEWIGRFQIRRCLGKGSFGGVYLAYDPKLNRDVAIKVAHFGSYCNEKLRSRFLREAHAAARMAHQNVVSLHEYGDSQGLLYLVYEMCQGPTLENWLTALPDGARPSGGATIVEPAIAVAIAREICRGLAHAHSRGMIHRDVKPGNILLQPHPRETEHELPFTPRITDFGLAHDLLDAEHRSQSLGLVGTIDYMAPEQARAESNNIQPATDLYSLGVIFYRLLTGRLPFESASNPVEKLQHICTLMPRSPRSICNSIPKDLAAICLKCLEKSPKRRYSSCEHLGRDLDRFARGEPVEARPLSVWERSYRLVAARPMVSALLTTIMLVCLSSAVVYSKLASDLRVQQLQLHEARNIAISNQHVAISARQAADSAQQAARVQWKEARRQTLIALRSSYRAELYRAYEAAEEGHILSAVESLTSIEKNIEGHFEVGTDFRLLAATLPTGNWRLTAHSESATEVVSIRGTSIVASSGQDGRLQFHNHGTGELLHSQVPLPGFQINALSISPNGQLIAVSFATSTLGLSHLRLYRLHPYSTANWLGQVELIHTAPATIENLQFSPTGRLLAVGTRYDSVSIFDLEHPTQLRCSIPAQSRHRSLSFSPNESQCLITSKENELWIADTQTGEIEQVIPVDQSVYFACWSPCGQWIAYTEYASSCVKLYSTKDMTIPRLSLKQPHGAIESLAFSAHGGLLIAGTRRGAVVAWAADARPCGIVSEFLMIYCCVLHDAPVSAVCAVEDRMSISAAEDGTLVAVPLPTSILFKLSDSTNNVCVLHHSDQSVLITGRKDGSIVGYHLDGSAERQILGPCHAQVTKLAKSADERWLAVGWSDGCIAIVDHLTGRTTPCGYTPPADSLDLRVINDLCFSDDSRLVAACGDDARVRVWATDQPASPVWEFTATSKAFSCCFVGQNLVALGGMFEQIILLDAKDGSVRQRIPGANRTQCLRYDSNSNRLLSGHQDGKVRVFDAATTELITSLNTKAGSISILSVTAAGECYLTGGQTGQVKVWNADSCSLVGTLKNLPVDRVVRCIEFCPHEELLIVLHDSADQPGDFGREIISLAARR